MQRLQESTMAEPDASSPVPGAPASAPRRALAAALLLGPWVITARAQAPARPLRPTPAQTEGPFYPLSLPADHDADLLRNGSRAYGAGTPVWLAGTVQDVAGQALRGGQVEIWQCDHQGHYHHPGDGGQADPSFQGFGRVTLDAEGRYRFRTIAPVPYSGRTPHIHLKVKLGSRELLTTQVYMAGHPGNERDFLWRRLGEADRSALTVPFSSGEARFPIVVQA